jgi:glycosyltransferase involved in cell wall biosynthesis
MNKPWTKDSTPLFSVLIANYNNGQYLEECLQSVFNQTYTNWEIILVDDGSTDEKSHELYLKYMSHEQIKIFLNQGNKGCGYAKRRCAEEANGKICAFLDPDDTITLDALEIMVNKHIELPDFSLVYSTHYLCDENLTISKINDTIKQVDEKGYFCSRDAQVSHFASYKNEFYKATSGINPSLKRAVDQDLYYKLEETGPFYFVNQPLYFYRRHEAGISTAKNALKAKYWHAKVITNTYRRRATNNFPLNRDITSINKVWSDYYMWKAQEKASQGKTCKTIYLVYQCIKQRHHKPLDLIMLIPYAIKNKIKGGEKQSNNVSKLHLS